jgi:hypothetical protein
MRDRIAGDQNVQPLVTGQAELERDGAARFSGVESRGWLYRRVETGKIEDYVVAAHLAGRVAGQVKGGESESLETDGRSLIGLLSF